MEEFNIDSIILKGFGYYNNDDNDVEVEES